MDLATTARYFDNQGLDVYIPAATPDVFGTWDENRLTGQVKLADKFLSIYNRPTRKRMLYLSPLQLSQLTDPLFLLRISGDAQIFMAQTSHQDFWKGEKYRSVLPVHLASGPVNVLRRNLAGDIGDTLVYSTVGDYELRTSKSNIDTEFIVESSFYVFLPGDIELKANDVLEFVDEGTKFVVLTPYLDSGLSAARAEKLDASGQDGGLTLVSYTSFGDGVYSPATQSVTYPAQQVSDIACRLRITNTGDDSSATVEQTLEALIHKWEAPSGFNPKISDVIEVFGAKYYVSGIKLDSAGVEWAIRAKG